VINAPPPGTPYPALWVSRELFASHLAALRAAGYHAVTLQRVWDAWTGRYALPSKPIVISFDDGYLSQYTHAKPALRRMGWPGVLNLKVGNIGPGGLTKHMVRAMIAAGWEVDAHTITHPDLTKVGAAQLQQEVGGSRAILRRDFHVPVAFFCYPAGRFDATAEAAVRRAGFLAATTTQPGLAAPGGDDFALPRIRVNGGETAAELMATLRSARIGRPQPGAAIGE
jgi:peptidoglycan/xylan/chitin deacetylase (PgdA/CDA1 family)